MLERSIAAAPAVAALWASWLAIILLFTGTGAMARYAFSSTNTDGENGSEQTAPLAWLDFWVGFATATLLLQFWNLWLPIDGRPFIVLTLCAIPGLALRWREKPAQSVSCRLVAGSIVAIAAPWLALHVLGPMRDGDTGLYHLQSVSWAASFPIVPGLANLHDRLAFNSTFHLYAALCEALPGNVPAFRVANPPLLVVALAQLAGFAAGRGETGWQRAHGVFSLLMIGPLLAQTQRHQFYGLAPDFAVFAVQVAVSGLLFRLLARGDAAKQLGYAFFALPVMCATGIALKLSAAVFAVVAVAVCIEQVLRARWAAHQHGANGAFLRGSVAAALLLGIWAVRGVVLSGYPAYPTPLFAMPVDWRLPRPLALDMNHWIRSWARLPEMHWVEVLGDHSWMGPWLWRNFSALEAPAFGIAAGLLLAAYGLLRTGRLPARSLRLVAPSLLAAAAWFVTAPDIRFGIGAIWISTASIFALGWQCARGSAGISSRRAIELGIGMALCAYLLSGARPIPRIAVEPVPAPEIRHYSAADGTRIHYPHRHNKCWDAPLPCTPYRRPSLRLRRAGELASGFRLAKPAECINIHSCRPLLGLRAPGDLGVDLVQGDWHAWDTDSNHRWMNSTGRLILYVESPRAITLRMHADAVARNPASGRLTVSFDSRPHTIWSVVPGEVSTVDLELQDGFNIVALQTADPTHHRPVWNARDGLARVAFSMIEIADRALP